jgi:rubrerythrin
MKERTAGNVHTAFVEEAKAHQRLLMFAKKAEEEELPQIAHLFRAVAAAEGVHSRRHFAMLESVADTQSNLERAFQSENAVNGILSEDAAGGRRRWRRRRFHSFLPSP